MHKYIVFIVSGGRTGTTFLGRFLSNIVENSYSVHEPDIFEGLNRKTWGRIKTFGIYHMILGRVLGRTGIRNLSQRYQSDKISFKSLCRKIQRQRNKYYSSVDADLIVESYYQWYGILTVLPYVFRRYKVVGLVRDPRDWVTSGMNFEAHFGRRDLVTRLGFSRLNPKMVGDARYARKWVTMSSFQKLCWTWSRVYECILTFIQNDPHSALFRYEDLFLSDERNRHFKELLDFMSDFGERQFHHNFRSELLRKKINESNRNIFSDWQYWDPAQAIELHEMCGPLMSKFSYGNEQEWQNKLK